jgi:hypothetical protein
MSSTLHLADRFARNEKRPDVWRMPTEAELDYVIDRPLAAAAESLESLVVRLRIMAGLTCQPMPGRLETAPTLETIGLLWTLIIDLRLNLTGMLNHVEELADLMPYVEEFRRERQVNYDYELGARR